MSPEAQRIAIATACGTMQWGYGFVPDKIVHCDVPDYLNCLNAMHRAEIVLSRGENYNKKGGFGFYLKVLAEVCAEEHPIDATASQRAEAFLRTFELWEKTT